ncbi:CAP domain-containing protein [Sphingopyxis sp. USTB-05]|uniref:CAP domain-containing protein n=1 Tax=Sphingopyxis sp. USTB-05 TaxID=2830667 RepID=UPI00207851C1|nr:CAP domain-containing protein [Sphingopyxis sp. USTB-05]USI78580.1 CAP domain-containing protein [Sphingopyxis sp. USTB-05]
MTKPSFLVAAGVLVFFGVSAAATAQSRFEEGVFTELNRFRSDPAAYTDYLRDYRPRFEGKLLVAEDDSEIDIMTREGVVAVDEAISDLGREKPLPTLEWSDALSRAAADHVAIQSRSGEVGHYTKGRGPGERMKARGGGPYVNEVITYGHHTPEGVVDQLLIDDGVPDRGHRHSLLRSTHRYAGVACGSHPVHRTMCVILMSQTRDGSPPPPPQRKSP